MDLVRIGPDLAATDPVGVEVLLHPSLKVRAVTASGATIQRRFVAQTSKTDKSQAREHVIVLDKPAESFTLFVEYAGELFQDVGAGEVAGQIHNFDMQAHIGEEGVYLAEGHWYPQPAVPEDAPVPPADFEVIVDPVPGFELKAGAERDAALSKRTGRLAWRSAYPVPDMVLVGGPHEVHRYEHDGITIDIHLKASQKQHAEGLSSAVKRYLDRYQPLVGPYPAREYAVVDNFFSSGFAFPTFTLLSSAVIEMGRRSQTMHGFLDHEMLHCWWGNGVFVDPQDGNWCEALTSYATNYYGYVLDGDEAGARRKRRNDAHFLGRMKPEDDKPLGTFGLPDGCGRGIGYSKGAEVFHMLARRIGQDVFWAAVRRFNAEYLGKYASWDDLSRVFEEESGEQLDTFFEQWVRGSGAPSVSIDRAVFRSAEGVLVLSLAHGERAFELDLPIRMTHAEGEADVVVSLSGFEPELSIPVDFVPLTVEVDPDYHVFRKIPPGEVVPTTAATRYGHSFTTVRPRGELPEPYLKLQSIFESDFEEEERQVVGVDYLADGVLAETCVLILGEAVRDPYVAAFLGAIEFPVRWYDDGFELADRLYTDPEDAVLATAAHPGVPGGGVTVLFANSAEAIPNPRHVTFYSHSVVVFRGGRPTLRRDLEHRNIVTVEVQ